MLKRFMSTKKADPPSSEVGKAKASFVASTANEDRHGDIISQNWDLKAYENNNIVLLNHNRFELPIGRGAVKQVDDQLMIDVEFDMEDPRASEVYSKVSRGFLNAVSVGFRPLSYMPRSALPTDHYAYGDKGNYYEKSELMEVSIVTIPANSDATAIKDFDPENDQAEKINEVLDRYETSIKHMQLLIGSMVAREDKGDHWMVKIAKGSCEDLIDGIPVETKNENNDIEFFYHLLTYRGLYGND